MTTKELALVLAVAGVGGGGAGVAAGLVRSAQEPPPAPDATAEIASRLERIENALARAAEQAEKSRDDVADVRERMTALEIERARDAAEPSAATHDAASDTAKAAVERVRRARMPTFRLSGEEGRQLVFGAGGEAGEAIDLGKLEGLDQAMAGISEELKGVGNGLRLRLMSEDKRWEQAKTDLGLNDTQVDTLKRAVEERDAAMKEAFEVEEQTATAADGGGLESTLRIRRLDPEKAATAQSNYRKKVDETLDENQRKSWREKGYDHAMGKHPGGGNGAVVIRASSIQIDDARDGVKAPK